MNKLKRFWSNLRSSFWFMPSLIVLASIGFAVALIEADSAGTDRWLAQLHARFHPQGQMSITEELLDIVAGYEALSSLGNR
jgi:uncharacterized membrane protein